MILSLVLRQESRMLWQLITCLWVKYMDQNKLKEVKTRLRIKGDKSWKIVRVAVSYLWKEELYLTRNSGSFHWIYSMTNILNFRSSKITSFLRDQFSIFTPFLIPQMPIRLRWTWSIISVWFHPLMIYNFLIQAIKIIAKNKTSNLYLNFVSTDKYPTLKSFQDKN